MLNYSHNSLCELLLEWCGFNIMHLSYPTGLSFYAVPHVKSSDKNPSKCPAWSIVHKNSVAQNLKISYILNSIHNKNEPAD